MSAGPVDGSFAGVPGRRHVLVVDDDDGVRDAVSEALVEAGYGVAQASNGIEALEWLRANRPPCLILLDIMMPYMNGIAFREAQLGDASLRDIPVVVISAIEVVERVLLRLPVLKKPFGREELLARVAAWC